MQYAAEQYENFEAYIFCATGERLTFKELRQKVIFCKSSFKNLFQYFTAYKVRRFSDWFVSYRLSERRSIGNLGAKLYRMDINSIRHSTHRGHSGLFFIHSNVRLKRFEYSSYSGQYKSGLQVE